VRANARKLRCDNPVAFAASGVKTRREEIPKPDELAKRGGAWFRCGSAAIHLGVDAAFVAAKKAHPALRSANYLPLLERLARHGVSITPDDLPFDGKAHAYIEDPFGNRIELIEA